MAINFPNSPALNSTFTNNGVLYTWDGISWTAGQPYRATRLNVVATTGQLTYSVTYAVGTIAVFKNGIRLIETDQFTATTGTSVTLITSPSTGDILTFESLQTWNITSGSVTGNFNVNGVLSQNSVPVSTVAQSAALAIGLS
jgi:hypothetical protein